MSEVSVDLTQLKKVIEDAGEGQPCHIMHPVTDEPTGIVITVVGRESKQFRTAYKKVQTKRIKNARGGAQKLTADLMEDDACEVLSACSLNWSGVVENGQVIEFSHENAKRLYMDYPFIRDQVDTFVGNLENFTKPSSKA